MGHASINCRTSSINHSSPRTYSNPLGSCTTAAPRTHHHLPACEALAHAEARSLLYPSVSEVEPSYAFGLPYCHIAQDSFGESASFDRSEAVNNHWTLSPGNAFTDFDPVNFGPLAFLQQSSEAFPYHSGLCGESGNGAAGDLEGLCEESPMHCGTRNTPEDYG